jgi:hypothetical protein
MSYLTWTADALKSNFKSLKGSCWRLVEAQHRISTLKLVDTREEQERLEDILEETKPPFPPELKSHHFLLFTPFRYEPYVLGSRFCRHGQKQGVFYASENIETAMAETAFYRFLFFKESPDTPIPDNASEYTAFTVKYETDKAVDLTVESLVRNNSEWTMKDNYKPCQFLADEARKVSAEIIHSFSVRCAKKGKNISLISWRAFRSREPERTQTWKMSIKSKEIVAICDFPQQSVSFSRTEFEADPRIRSLS